METKTGRSKRILIEVTLEDIHNARGGSRGCPIALAGQRLFEDPELTVGANSMWRRNGDEDLTEYRLPPSAREFISAFDFGDPVEPFTFSVKVPD